MKRWLILVAVAALLGTACGQQGPEVIGPAPTGTGTTEPTVPPGESPSPKPEDTVTLEVWFTYVSEPAGERLFVTRRTLPATPAVGRAVLTELLEGPTREEAAAGVITAIPQGTKLLDLSIADGVATVDLSGEFAGPSRTVGRHLAQVVYTLTQFRTVDGVVFRVNGDIVETIHGRQEVDLPDTRRDFRGLLPQILVESPLIGERVKSPVTIAGSADVFEATVSISILDEGGKPVAQTFTTATCGTGCRGTYETNVDFEVSETQDGVILVFESSAKDGSPLFVVEIPVVLRA